MERFSLTQKGKDYINTGPPPGTYENLSNAEMDRRDRDSQVLFALDYLGSLSEEEIHNDIKGSIGPYDPNFIRPSLRRLFEHGLIDTVLHSHSSEDEEGYL
jgi:hypothetical protein